MVDIIPAKQQLLSIIIVSSLHVDINIKRKPEVVELHQHKSQGKLQVNDKNVLYYRRKCSEMYFKCTSTSCPINLLVPR